MGVLKKASARECAQKIVQVRIVPGDSDSTRGTQVLLDDGRRLYGVTRVELVAEMNDVWRARIDCIATVESIGPVSANVQVGRNLSWWRRFMLRIAGVDHAQTGHLGGSEQELTSIIKQLRALRSEHDRD